MTSEHSSTGEEIVDDNSRKDATVTDFSIDSLLKSKSDISKRRKQTTADNAPLTPRYKTTTNQATLCDRTSKSLPEECHKRYADLEDRYLEMSCSGFRLNSDDGHFRELCASMFKRSECYDAEALGICGDGSHAEKESEKMFMSQDMDSTLRSCETNSHHENKNEKDKPIKSVMKRANSYYSSMQNEIEYQFVRALLDLLLHPPSALHQQWVVQILKENVKVRQIFKQEKTRLGIKRIPVFKQKRNDEYSVEDSSNES